MSYEIIGAICAAVYAALQVLQALTPHFSQYAGVKKLIMGAIEILSIVHAAGRASTLTGKLKLPVLPSGRALWVLLLVAAIGSSSACTTVGGETKWSPENTYKAACYAVPGAQQLTAAVCASLPEGKHRDRCVKAQAEIAKWSGIAMAAGGAILGACAGLIE
ncbi:MAG: hypothetical protein GY835_23870 [bacterium]|nr:hypothetical protein [bacterium]